MMNPQIAKEGEMILLFSQEAAKIFNTVKAITKDRQEILYTCCCRSISEIEEYKWRDRQIVYRGPASDIVAQIPQNNPHTKVEMIKDELPMKLEHYRDGPRAAAPSLNKKER